MSWYEEQAQSMVKAKKAIPEFMKAFKKQNIKRAKLCYRGYGDSGDAWDWTFYDSDNNSIEFDGWSNANNSRQAYEQLGLDQESLQTFDNHIENLLSYDWVNNEGGGGTIHFNFQDLSIAIDAYQCETIERSVNDSIVTEYKFNESS